MQEDIQKQVAADLGIAHLPDDKQKELIAQFGEVALKAATLAVLGKLSEDKRNEFMKLAEAGDSSAVQTFLDAEVPGHEDMAKQAVAEELSKFKSFAAGA